MSTTLLERGRRGDSLADLEIIDLHAHFSPFCFTIPETSAESMVATMDRIGVKSTVCSSMACMIAETTWGNDQVRDAMHAFPGRILGYFSVYPYNAADVARETEQRIKERFTGLKLHSSNGFAYNDPNYAPAYEAANACRMPVLLHVWGEEKSFSEIREMANRYPDANFLLAHSGSANPQGYVKMANSLPNVYLDLAYSVSPPGLVRSFVEVVGAEKITWGSDVYFFSQAQQIGKVLGAKIPEADKIRILSTNAREILGRVRYP